MFFTDNALRWLESLLEERFGHKFELLEQSNAIILTKPDVAGRIKFDQLETVFHQTRSNFPCKEWEPSSEGFSSVIDKKLKAPSEKRFPEKLFELNKNSAIVHYDILGLTYWMLTRLEEVNSEELDVHQRFPALSSHAYKHSYLERPIVDEWLFILGQMIQKVWPNINLKQHKFNIKVSHDVDRPSRYGFCSYKALIRSIGGDLLKRQNIKDAIKAPWIRINTKKSLSTSDPFNTFDWLMEISEEKGLTSAFYFICGKTHSTLDSDYNLQHQAIRELMNKIHSRGHEIGLHPSYNTYQDERLICLEATRLRQVCEEENIEQASLGGRMHYLRWKHPITMRALESAGLTYDSSLGYADRPGFRCGTCHEYSAFDPVNQKKLDLRLRPLIVMEGTIFSKQYLGLKTDDAIAKFDKLKGYCRKVGGTFSLLWHNNQFLSNESRYIYINLLD